MQGDKKKGIVHTSTRCMGWNPETGESEVFDSPEAREAKGWLDHHPNDEEKGGAGDKPHAKRPGTEDPDDVPLTRDEIIAALKEGGINFRETATDTQLDNALKGALRKALTTRNVEFTNKESSRALLAKLKASLTQG